LKCPTPYILNDILIDFLKGRYHILDKIKSVGILNWFVSEISIAELHFGVHYSTRKDKHKNEPFYIADSFNVVPISNVLEAFGIEKARLTKSGIKIPDFDLLIATTAVKYGYTLVTANTKHFERVEKLIIKNWREPEFNEFIV